MQPKDDVLMKVIIGSVFLFFSVVWLKVKVTAKCLM